MATDTPGSWDGPTAEVGLAAPEAHALALARFPELRDLPGSQMVTQMFPRLFGAVGADSSFPELLALARKFRPHVMMHDAADFAPPVVAATIGVPNVYQGFGFAVPAERVQLAADRAVDLWADVGLELRPFRRVLRSPLRGPVPTKPSA